MALIRLLEALKEEELAAGVKAEKKSDGKKRKKDKSEEGKEAKRRKVKEDVDE